MSLFGLGVGDCGNRVWRANGASHQASAIVMPDEESRETAAIIVATHPWFLPCRSERGFALGSASRESRVALRIQRLGSPPLVAHKANVWSL
jgi:hypothetical protein